MQVFKAVLNHKICEKHGSFISYCNKCIVECLQDLFNFIFNRLPSARESHFVCHVHGNDVITKLAGSCISSLITDSIAAYLPNYPGPGAGPYIKINSRNVDNTRQILGQALRN